MTTSLSVVLKTTVLKDSGFGTESSVFRTVAPVESHTKSKHVLMNSETVEFQVGAGHRLTQFILSGPREGLYIDLSIQRGVLPVDIVRLKAGGLFCINDSDVRLITVQNVGIESAEFSVIISKERTT